MAAAATAGSATATAAVGARLGDRGGLGDSDCGGSMTATAEGLTRRRRPRSWGTRLGDRGGLDDGDRRRLSDGDRGGLSDDDGGSSGGDGVGGGSASSACSPPACSSNRTPARLSVLLLLLDGSDKEMNADRADSQAADEEINNHTSSKITRTHCESEIDQPHHMDYKSYTDSIVTTGTIKWQLNSNGKKGAYAGYEHGDQLDRRTSRTGQKLRTFQSHTVSHLLELLHAQNHKN
ncbi:hypothetical protein OsJ_00260 [Oryza sativa Japonica Group]|uniref:Uncharacterized protein n=1 Tax=Oryza sativa subsp. japonica TaxID=39947 RepID=B9EZC9_ORYSJ|nr:hypothetical protein OsJ_00260 [Oryza sativa Japonica Group]